MHGKKLFSNFRENTELAMETEKCFLFPRDIGQEEHKINIM